MALQSNGGSALIISNTFTPVFSYFLIMRSSDDKYVAVESFTGAGAGAGTGTTTGNVSGTTSLADYSY